MMTKKVKKEKAKVKMERRAKEKKKIKIKIKGRKKRVIFVFNLSQEKPIYISFFSFLKKRLKKKKVAKAEKVIFFI